MFCIQRKKGSTIWYYSPIACQAFTGQEFKGKGALWCAVMYVCMSPFHKGKKKTICPPPPISYFKKGKLFIFLIYCFFRHVFAFGHWFQTYRDVKLWVNKKVDSKSKPVRVCY